jgi:hypothetical protein
MQRPFAAKTNNTQVSTFVHYQALSLINPLRGNVHLHYIKTSVPTSQRTV